MSGFFNESYGKFAEDDADKFIIMEYNNFLSHLADANLPDELSANADFLNWMLKNPDVLFQTADQMMMTLPSPRYKHY